VSITANEGDRLAAVANVPADEDKEIDEALPEITKGKTPPAPPEPEQGSIFEG
jgi:hypothetical protein